MMRSLYSGVAGLRTHQTKMDVLGNNIANVNTTSFKSQSITFSDLMYQTTQSASGATETKGGVNARQIGLGAKSGAIATAIESQGATQTTNNPFDIMITGKSFFVVNNGKENLYTRDGSFYVDGAGNLAMQSNGYFVMGWTAQEDPETGAITVNKNGGLSQLQIMSADNTTYSPASTTAALFSGNIDDNDTNVVSDDGKTLTLEFYDNKGYLYTGKFTLKDTGTDDLFSLQLTDIIDSSGTSIGSALMKGVTFGATETTDVGVTDAYSVEVGATTSTVNLLAGATVYSGVPTSGVLSDLMTTSKSKYAGILQKVYGIDDATVTSKTEGYSKTSAYTISESGTLTITYDDPKETKSPTGYTYNGNNSNSYYVSTSGTGLAYNVPSASEGEVKTVVGGSKTLQATLKNVFGMTDAELTTFTGSSYYRFNFNSNSAGNDTFIVTSTHAPNAATTASTTSKTALAAYYNDFDGLEDALATADENLYYTYTDSTLTVFKSEYDTTSTTPVQASATGTTTNLSGLTTNTIYAISDLSDAQKAELEAALPGCTDDYAYVNITSLTGTNGIIFYDNGLKTKAGDQIYSDKIFSKTFTANENTYPVKTASELGGVFTSSADGSSYVLTGNETTVADLSADMLKNVFGLTKGSETVQDAYKVSISANGQISIYDTVSIPKSISTSYATQTASDGTLTYVTTTDTVEYSDVPNTGNITDLISTATGTYKNLLSKVYGISDSDADAFGTDGTYSINADGSITLTTGSQTIQLKFNPANGSLTTANGNANGMVNIKFDQTIPGLEAFGFQPTTADEEAMRGQLTVDFSTVTNYNTSGTATIKAVKGDKSSLNTGRMVGEMNGVTIATDGQIHATYSNGQTKLLGQIASAEFANASGLSKEGDNLYASTLNSGEATIQDITTDGGYMNTGVLEMSNVDLSKEFTEMITTQRGFQANSRIITVSDTLLEELTNLKR
ncbi:flagellar hook-basal body complex protein [Butyrivibrio sp. AE2015]|uniref:flagellar hook-basal body complex protein n=1 Tax=Butyrivibrio sp. AE2015 TaxID=1280663 RepID=UPI0003B5C19D|nr:flagellar hook-basal body complex protein [Butyrivibrio sp. AE2015]